MKTVSKEQEKLNEMISEKLQLVNKAKETFLNNRTEENEIALDNAKKELSNLTELFKETNEEFIAYERLMC